MLTAILSGFLLVLLGVVFCLFGYRLFVFLLPIWGFIVGFLLGAQLITSIFGDGLLSTVSGWIVGFGIGILVAILSYFIYSFGVYMLATTFGLVIGALLMYAIGIESGLVITVVALGLAALMIALVAYLDLKKWLIVFVTAFGGSIGVIAGILIALGTISLSDIQSGLNPVTIAIGDSILWAILWGAIGIVGLVFQTRTTKEFFQGEDYNYYHRIINQEQDVTETVTTDEVIEQDIASPDDVNVGDQQDGESEDLMEPELNMETGDQESADGEISPIDATSGDQTSQDEALNDQEKDNS